MSLCFMMLYVCYVAFSKDVFLYYFSGCCCFFSGCCCLQDGAEHPGDVEVVRLQCETVVVRLQCETEQRIQKSEVEMVRLQLETDQRRRYCVPR
jgi:hypothetical protein